MDFNKIFASYTNNDSSQRSNILSEDLILPQNIISNLKNFVDTYDSNEIYTKNLSQNSKISDSDSPTTTSQDANISDPIIDNSVPQDILEALSQLDTPPIEDETSSDTSNDLDLEELTEDNDDIPSDTSNDLDLEELTEDNDDIPSDTSNDLDLEELTEDNDDIPSDTSNDLDLEELTEDNDDIPSDTSNDLDLEELTEDNDDIPSDTSNDLDLEELTEDNDDIPSDTSNDLDLEELTEDNDDNDLSNFLNSFSDDEEISSNIDFDDDFEEDHSNIWTEEVESSMLNDNNNEFDIEIPEEFNDAIQEISDETSNEDNSSIQDDIEDITLPNFIDKDEVSDQSFNNIEDNVEFLDSEQIDPNTSFDTWSKNTSTPSNVSHIELSQDQIFKIRSKINSLSNKNLRFQIREVIADPNAHQSYYDQLISLLLIDASEESIQKLLEISENTSDTENYNYADISTTKPSFLADDVASYQDSIDRLKNELIYNLKKYSLYGLVILLSGIIAWLGVAQPIQVNSIYQKGLEQIQENNFINGEGLFHKAMSVTGQPSAEWLVKYANVYRDKNIIKEASKKYHLAIAIEPQNIDIAIQASDFYTNLGKEYYSNAIHIMENNIKFHPKKFEPWDFLGSIYISYSDFFMDDREKQTEILYSAANIYQKFIINNPKNTAPYYKMIDIYIRIGNREQIDKIYKLISDLKPRYINLDIVNKLSKYYIDHRALDNASTLLKKTLPMLDNYSRNVPELQKIMNKYYNIDPSQISNILSESYYEFARYKMLSSNIKESAQLLTNAIIFNSNHSAAFNLLGENYLQSSHITEIELKNAERLFNHSLGIDPKNYKAHINLGHMNYFWDTELGNIDTAHKTALFHYNIAKSMMPKNIKNDLMSYNHGWLLYQNKEYNSAIDSWSDIYKATPNDPVLSYALGSALFQINNPQLAQIEFSKTINLFENIRKNIPIPDIKQKRHKEIYTQLAKAYNNLGVINANYAIANPRRTDYFSSQALLNFYNAQDLSNQLNSIYSTAEYNIGVLTRSQIKNRMTIFDDNIPKQTSIENPKSAFNKLLLQDI